LRILPPIAVVLFAAIFFAPELFGGRVAATANMTLWRPWAEQATPEERAAPSHNPDCNLSYYPRRFVLHEAWREGVIPFWNPYSFCGTPFLADPQAGVFYPPNWILLPWSPATQLGWFLFLHVAWGGIGALVLARRTGAPAELSALAGCAFALNEYFVKHFGQPPFLATTSWLPWVLAAALDVVELPTLRRLARLALAGALMFLAGQPQTALHGAYAAALVAGAALAVRRSEPVPVIAAVLGAGALAVLLVAAQLLPTIDLASRSARSVLPYGSVVSGAFHPVEAIRFVVPEFFGTPLTRDEWSPLFPRGDGFYLRNQINALFAGTPVFALALWGMVAARTRRAASPFTALFAVAALVAFGSPLARLAYELLPGFRFSRVDRAGSLVVLAQIVPAALGAADLVRARGTGRRVFGAAVVAAAVAGAWLVERAGSGLPARLGADGATAAIALDPGSVERVVTRTRAAALFAAGAGCAFLLPASRFAAGLPLALTIVQLFAFAGPYRGDRAPGDVFPPAPGIARLAEELGLGGEGGTRFLRFGRDLPVQPYPVSSILPPSTNVPYRLRDVQGYNALADRRLGELLESALGEELFSHGIWAGRRIVEPTRDAALEHPLLDALSVGAVASVDAITAQGWREIPAPGFRLWRNEQALPRVRLAPGGRGVAREEMAAILRDGRFDPRTDVLWPGDGLVVGEVGPHDEAEVLVDSWNELAVRTLSSAGGMLVVADSWAPGWRATIDGAPAEVLPVWGVVRGLAIPAGLHEVVFRYEPPGLRIGIAMSLLGLLAAGTALTVGARRGTSEAREGLLGS
jgi:hypothetical protein